MTTLSPLNLTNKLQLMNTSRITRIRSWLFTPATRPDRFDKAAAAGADGQLDFVRGAYASKGGKSIIACHSTAAKGKVSRIVARLDGPVTIALHHDLSKRQIEILLEGGAINWHKKYSKAMGHKPARRS